MSIFLLSNETSDDEEEVGNDYEDDELPSFINEGRREAQEHALKNEIVEVQTNASRISIFLHL